MLIVRRDEVLQCLDRDPTHADALALLERTARELGVPNRVVSYRDERTYLRYPPEGAEIERDLWIVPMFVPTLGCAAIRIGTGGDSIMALYDFDHMGLRGLVQDQPLGTLRAGLGLALGAKALATPGPIACWGATSAIDVAVQALGVQNGWGTVAVNRGTDAAGVMCLDAGDEGMVARVAAAEVALKHARLIAMDDPSGAAGVLPDRCIALGATIVTTDLDRLDATTLARALIVQLSKRHSPEGFADALELGQILRGEHPGRQNREQIIVYVAPREVGFVDVATAWWAYGCAHENGVGVEIPLVSSGGHDEAVGL